MRRLFGLAGVAMAIIATPAAPLRAAQAVAASAATDNRAVVVVDTGDGEPRRACVVFSQPTITGLEALRTTRMDPVVQGYSGQGGAVCKLCGVGCDAGSSCLTCQAPKYWQYWRSVSGGPYTYSNVGAGSTQVRDGDVEGWKWGETKGAPPFYSIDTVCSDPARTFRYEPSTPAPTTEPPPRSSTTTPAASTTTSTARSSGSASMTTLAADAPSQTTSSVVAPEASTMTTAPTAPTDATTEESDEDEGDKDEIAAPAGSSGSSGGGGSSLAAVVGFVVLLGGIGAATIRARRVRASPTDPA